MPSNDKTTITLFDRIRWWTWYFRGRTKFSVSDYASYQRWMAAEPRGAPWRVKEWRKVMTERHGPDPANWPKVTATEWEKQRGR